MKKSSIYKCIFLLIVFVIFIMVFKVCFYKQTNQLVYDYKSSVHHEFYFENGYVVFRDEIKIRNTVSNDLHFYMTADISEDTGLVVESTAIACEQNSLQIEKFFIKGNSEQVYTVYFKVKKGEKDTKLNRLPPRQVTFKVLE